MASYPGAVKSFTTKNAGDTIQPADVNDVQDEIAAMEAGLLNGTAPLNSSHSTLASLSVTGGSSLASLQVSGNSTLASSITIGGLPYIFPSAGGSTGQALVITSTSGSTMTLGWGSPAVNALTLLHAASGNDSNAGATTVDSFAITGLTALDSLKVVFAVNSVTQATGTIIGPYHVTDGVFMGDFATGNNIVGGGQAAGESVIKQTHLASTSVLGVTWDVRTYTGGSALEGNGYKPSLTTAWTGSWTLGLRHSGVTAGGTFHYSWAVYRISGQ